MNRLFIVLSFLILPLWLEAQSKSKENTPDYSNWIVDLSQSRVSFAGIRLEKVTLNDDYTIVQMSFFNRSWYPSWIEACNTFHIRANGKRVANFVKAEGIPTRDVRRHSFTCADERTAMKVYSGQLVRFRIYFTRIPTFLNKIDIIEYDGMQNCEFDVFNLNISEKKPIPSNKENLAKSKPENTKPDAPKTTPPVNKIPKKDDAIVASKTPKPTPPKPNNEPPKSTKQPENDPVGVVSNANIIAPEKREVKVKREYFVDRNVLQIEIWDNDKEDGDVVSLMLNDRWVIKGLKVTKTRKKIEIPLQPGDNKLIFHADNLGSAPPNTAALSFNDGLDTQTIVLNSDFDSSEAIRIIRK